MSSNFFFNINDYDQCKTIHRGPLTVMGKKTGQYFLDTHTSTTVLFLLNVPYPGIIMCGLKVAFKSDYQTISNLSRNDKSFAYSSDFPIYTFF